MREQGSSHFARARAVDRAAGAVPDGVVLYGTILQK